MKLNVNSPAYVVGFAAAVSAAFTAAVISVQVAAAGKIRRNEALREERALVQLFGLADEPDALSAEACAERVRSRIDRGLSVRDPETGREFRLFNAYRTAAKAELQALAFETSGNGFWAPITALVALTPDLGQAVGIVFLDHKETPGLGGRITERGFQEKFAGLNVAPPAGDGKFVYVEKERPDSPRDPRWGRTVDAITGATQTSMAVARFLNRDLVQFRRAMAAERSSRAKGLRLLRAVCGKENSGWAHLMGSSGFAVDPRRLPSKSRRCGRSKRENKPNGAGFVF